jgi:hypothetical protein
MKRRNDQNEADALPAREWWEYYIDGKIIRRDDTPQSIVSTLEDWCIQCMLGDENPMRLFTGGRPVNPRELAREIDECIVSDNKLTEKERKSIFAARTWVIRESQLAEAAKELRKAREAFVSAADTAGIDDYHRYKIASAAV